MAAAFVKLLTQLRQDRSDPQSAPSVRIADGDIRLLRQNSSDDLNRLFQAGFSLADFDGGVHSEFFPNDMTDQDSLRG